MQLLSTKLIDKDIIQCNACSWHCKLKNSFIGKCGVRYNDKSELKSIVHGKILEPQIDPIEKKPLFHFLPGSNILSFGTFGCNFNCKFCQNYWHTMPPKEICAEKINSSIKFTRIKLIVDKYSVEYTPEQIVQYALDTGCKSIAYTYNEPAIFVEFAFEVARLAKEKRLKNVFVSNGFESEESFDLIGKYLDAINIDLKAFSNEFYTNIVGGKLDIVKKNIEKYFQAGIWVEVTTLVITKKNDSNKELRECAEFLSSISDNIPWHVSAFHPAYKLTDVSPTTENKLREAYEIGKETGLNYVYVGNIFGEDLHSTFCPSCKELLIQRDWTYTNIVNLKNGKCGNCGREISGVWE